MHVGSSLDTNGFTSFINKQLKAMQEKLIKEKSLSILSQPKFADLLEKSLMVSSKSFDNKQLTLA